MARRVLKRARNVWGWLTIALFALTRAPTACGGSARHETGETNAADGGAPAVGGSGGSAPSADAPFGTTCTAAEELPGGYESCAEGFVHRPRTEDCPLPTNRVACDPATVPDTTLCATDSDCQGAPNGYCEAAGERCLCRYPCVTDADCGAHTPPLVICECREVGGQLVGTCNVSNCVTDADCPGTLCASTPGGNFGCFSPNDECRRNEDCDPGYVCGFDTDARRCFLENLGTAATGGR